LKQGERVTTARTSAKLDATLEAIGKQRESAGRSVTLNVNNTFSGKPDDATMMAIDSRNKELRKQIKAELTAEIASPNGPFGRTLRGVYPGRKIR
ncbi:phage tail tape measure protein, partial [Klebsiella sp. K822]